MTCYECLIDKTEMTDKIKIKTYYSMCNVDFKSKTKLYYTKFSMCQRYEILKKVYLLSDEIINEYKNFNMSMWQKMGSEIEKFGTLD